MARVIDQPSSTATVTPIVPPSPGLGVLLGDALLDPGLPLAIRAYDGSRWGADDPIATFVVLRPDAIRRMVTAPGQLGLARAFVAGDIEVDGDLLGALTVLFAQPPTPRPSAIATLVRSMGAASLRPLPPPPEESRLSGRLHSVGRDAAAISHHYDVGNDFYRLLLGPSMTYSCAVWERPDVGLDAAQAAKHQLVAEKLGLRPGMRLLDIGCGWGSMALHAAASAGAEVVAVTISEQQVTRARERVREAGLEGQVDIRLQDYRAISDGPFDAICSIGMFEHVGRARLAEYFAQCHDLLRPGGRLLNHGITRSPKRIDSLSVPVPRAPWRKRTFIDRYIFPDGELHELGSVISVMQHQGFEVRHSESLREHYALTLRAWIANLESAWDRAVELAGVNRARVWRLYLALSAVGFERGTIQVHQVLAAKPDEGRSGFPLRPAY